jgi:hypothetical protein
MWAPRVESNARLHCASACIASRGPEWREFVQVSMACYVSCQGAAGRERAPSNSASPTRLRAVPGKRGETTDASAAEVGGYVPALGS